MRYFQKLFACLLTVSLMAGAAQPVFGPAAIMAAEEQTAENEETGTDAENEETGMNTESSGDVLHADSGEAEEESVSGDGEAGQEPGLEEAVDKTDDGEPADTGLEEDAGDFRSTEEDPQESVPEETDPEADPAEEGQHSAAYEARIRSLQEGNYIVLEGDEETYEWEDIDNEFLYEEYAGRLFYGSGASAAPMLKRKSSASARLSGHNLSCYTYLKREIRKIADGDRTESIIVVPVEEIDESLTGPMYAEDLGLPYIVDENGELHSNLKTMTNARFKVTLSVIMNALRADCPYELYWHLGSTSLARPNVILKADEEGVPYVVYDGGPAFKLKVEETYRADKTNEYLVDAVKTGAASAAVSNAATYVEEAQAASASDYEILLFYMRTIKDLVEYDYDAIEQTDTLTDRGAWNLVYVFDNNPDTNVVCEGYAEAFQYLCNLTDFESDKIECMGVKGYLNKETSANLHKWNIVTMEDGLKYLVDVTACDTRNNENYFLKGASGSPAAWYKVYTSDTSYTSYKYYSETTAVYTSEDLTLSDTDYLDNKMAVDLKSASVNFDDSIGLNINMVIPDETLALEGAYVSCYIDRDVPVTKTFQFSDLKTVKKDGVSMRQFSLELVPKLYDTDVIITVHKADGRKIKLRAGETDYTNGYTYSVKKYCEKVLEVSDDDEMKELARKLMLYGACTQKFLHYKEDAVIDGSQLGGVTLDLLHNYNGSIRGSVPGIKLTAMSFMFVEKSAIRLKFRLDQGKIEDYQFTAGGKKLEPVFDGNLYYVEINGIAAKNLADPYILKVTDRNGNSMEASYCGISYAYLLRKYDTSAGAQNISAAMYKYYKAAHDYFN